VGTGDGSWVGWNDVEMHLEEGIVELRERGQTWELDLLTLYYGLFSLLNLLL
jgi:hypothetical protein